MLRYPAVAGQFYPATKAALEREIGKYISKDAAKTDAFGAVSPHAGYVYSGPVAGATLSHIEFKDRCIIIGPNHTGRGRPFSIMTEGVWKLPSGECRIDTELAKAILNSSGHLEEDTGAHMQEHSVEVQIPFIQALKGDFKFVPLVLTDADIEVYRQIGEGLAEALNQTHPSTIIASSDFTHYEPRDIAARKDKKAIEAILNLDEEALMYAVAKYDISMCGYAPICVMLAAVKRLGAKQTKLIKYQTSGEITGDYASVVGYAGILIY